jgi:predicted nucleic acid-binding protein
MTVSKLLDSSVWLTYFFNGSYTEIIEKQELFLLSSLSIFEIKRRMQKKKIPPAKIKKAMKYIRGKSLVVVVEPPIANKAAEVAKKHGLATVDAMIYASALSEKATVYTLDNDFRCLDHAKVLDYC